MLDAEVDIYIGEKTESPDEKIPINGKGAFTLENQSDADARIVIGFPLGDRVYSQYGLESFTASNDGQPASVYVATSGNKLPWRLFHLSSELTGGEMKAVDISDSQFPALKDVLMSGEPVSQLLLWEASIPAMTARVVEINYTLNIPWQSPEVFTRHVEGNKEVRRVMKDSISSEWLKVLDDKKKYLFFDYILATGASWKGEIGKEEIRIHLDSSWQGKEPQLFVANRDSDIESVRVVS
ncbi:hypothetical protein BOW39_08605 [Solemya velum gill symbiont]|uniref:hypothetical protein n=1 Tax=Solemya velum gill symbiont TaxID=2340 RepID=UPI000997C0E6|nr:hypothetical protein [Solemya velum gill symbiont]OOZ48794.1 hypothetical protein BOW39_08605 [Solemya velum gill symbiont]